MHTWVVNGLYVGCTGVYSGVNREKFSFETDGWMDGQTDRQMERQVSAHVELYSNNFIQKICLEE